MVNYRRNRIAGGTFFFTVALADRCSAHLTDHIELLREAFRAVRRARPFHTLAIVVLPEHLHAIWTLPATDDDDYPGRWRAIKSRFSRAVADRGVTVQRARSGEHRLWQRRYWEHTIRDASDLAHHADYIHFNPVKHGLVARVADWPHSSFHRYVRAGRLPRDWADPPEEGVAGYGE